MTNVEDWFAAAVAALLASLGVTDAKAGECRLESPAHRITLVELYTSEGCSSCPPADRWFGSLPQAGIAPEIAVLLAFHVDYWNELGWPDRFSRPAFTERQRSVATRASSGVIYTPQLVVDGRDLRQGYDIEHLRGKLAAINREQGQAEIRAEVRSSATAVQITGEVRVLATAKASRVQTWIAAFENELSTRVTAGENAGRRLNHDFVVRELAGPFSMGADGRIPLEHRIALRPDWNAQRMGIAIFVERPDTGQVLEASARYPLCAS